MQVAITLTQAGLEAGEGRGLAPLGLVFEYLAMLRDAGPQEWVWHEVKGINDMRFRCVLLSSTISRDRTIVCICGCTSPTILSRKSGCGTRSRASTTCAAGAYCSEVAWSDKVLKLEQLVYFWMNTSHNAGPQEWVWHEVQGIMTMALMPWTSCHIHSCGPALCRHAYPRSSAHLCAVTAIGEN